MSALLGAGTTLLAAAGLVVLAFALPTRRRREGIAMGLDLWTAAGLLGLSSNSDWRNIVVAAAVVAIRIVVVERLRRPLSRPEPAA